jgi:WD40 repeat protein
MTATPKQLLVVLVLATACRGPGVATRTDGSAAARSAGSAAPRAEPTGRAATRTSSPPSGPASSLQAPTVVPPDRSWVAKLSGVKVLSGKHPSGVLAVAFLPDGVHAMSSGVDEKARIWDLRTGEVVHTFSGPRFKFTRVVFTRDGQRALSAGDQPMYWTVATGDVLRELKAPDTDVTNAVALSHDERLAASGSPGSVFIWDLARGELLRRLDIRGQVLSVRFSDDDGHVQLTTDQSSCTVEPQGTAAPRCLDYPLPDVGRITTGSVEEQATVLGTREGLLFVWDSKTSRMRRHWAAQQSTTEVSDLDFSGTHHRAISVGDDTAGLWNVDSGRPIGSPLRIAGGPIAVRLSEDGRLALIGAENGDLRLWKLPELTAQ